MNQKNVINKNSDSSNRLVIALRISREYEQENSKIKAREFGELMMLESCIYTCRRDAYVVKGCK